MDDDDWPNARLGAGQTVHLGAGPVAVSKRRCTSADFLGVKGWLREAVRNLQVTTVGLNPLARVTAAKSSLAIASNRDTERRLLDIGAQPVMLQPDAAVDAAWFRRYAAGRQTDPTGS